MNPATLIASISCFCALVMLAYNLFFAPSRIDKKEVEKRLSKLEIDDANHETRLTGFSLQLERQSDHVDARCAKIEGQLNEVGRVREDVAVLKAKMDSNTESINEIKGMVNKIFDLLRPTKN